MIRIMRRGEVGESELFARKVNSGDVAGVVSEIIADVRANGDAALKRYNEKFDHAVTEVLEVAGGELDAALAAVPQRLVEVL